MNLVGYLAEKKVMSSNLSFSARLVVVEGNDKGKTFPLRSGAVVIGRSKSDIIINDPRISREHVKFEFDPEKGKLTFTDLKSLNGCQINGNSLQSGELKDGDKIQIGNTILDCQMGKSPELTLDTRKEPVLKTEKIQVPNETPQLQNESGPTVVTKTPRKISKVRRPVNLAIAASFILFLVLFISKPKPNTNTKQQDTDIQTELTAIKTEIDKEQPLQALSMATELQKKVPNHPEIEELLGDIYLKQKQIEPAIQNYKASIEHQNPSKAIHFKLTRAYLDTGFQTLAVEHLKTIDKIIKESPTDRDLFIELANLLLEHPEINSSFERGIIISKALQTEIAPESTIGYRLEGSVLSQVKKFTEAESVYQKALTLSPNDPEVLEQLASIKLNLQDLKGAKAITEKWLGQNPNDVKALLALSYLHFYEKDYLATIPKLMNIINLLSKTPEAPRRLEALHLLGLVYWEQGQRPEAESYLSQSCKLGFQPSCSHQALLSQESAPAPTPTPTPPPTPASAAKPESPNPP